MSAIRKSHPFRPHARAKRGATKVEGVSAERSNSLVFCGISARLGPVFTSTCGVQVSCTFASGAMDGIGSETDHGRARHPEVS